ncbi:MAG: hypothetical protein PHW50_02355 [Patescibacteria group bacterium]|nr:hypothetical protein [Patescibacteria group bacterium]
MFDAHGDLFQEFKASRFDSKNLQKIISQSLDLIIVLSGLISDQLKQIEAVSNIISTLHSDLNTQIS